MRADGERRRSPHTTWLLVPGSPLDCVKWEESERRWRLGPALVWNLPEGSPSGSLPLPSFGFVHPCPSWGAACPSGAEVPFFPRTSLRLCKDGGILTWLLPRPRSCPRGASGEEEQQAQEIHVQGERGQRLAHERGQFSSPWLGQSPKLL